MSKYIFSDDFIAKKTTEAIALSKVNEGGRQVLDTLKASIRTAIAEGLTIKRVRRDYAPAGAFTARPSWESAAALKRALAAPGATVETLYHYMSADGSIPEKLKGIRRVVSVHSAYLELSAANDSGHSRLDFKAADLMLLAENCFALTYTYTGTMPYLKTGKPVVVAIYKVSAAV